ncbi:MAG: energy transducer TonB [Zoogloea sp.]|uniref:energy transducer TonB n=1 Tax=Zoogloea sp. TaxID=49181 RepID=UPI0026210BA2|nr:energy transducer TonB [Zoogloea sp.]MDD3327904.1 energy transducer TonB [Zoogloea sp.]
MSQASQETAFLEIDMTAALSSQGLAAPALPAPFLALSRPSPVKPVRRNLAGVGVAVLLHGALLAAIVSAIGEVREPVVPPQPYMTVSLVTPPAETPELQPRPRAQPVKPKETQPVLQPKAKPSPSPKPAERPTLTSTATATNAAETTAVASAPPAPPAPAAAPVREAPVAVVPPRFDAAYLSNPAPVYPSASKRMGEEGRVLLRVQVGADGRPTDVSIAKSSGFSRLDDVARETVLRSWRFVPARQGDQAVAGAVKVPIDFTLSNT